MIARAKNRRANHQAGVSYIEAAIALPVMILVTLGCIDFARYFFTLHILNTAAHHAADTMSKSDVEVPIDSESCQSNPTECQRYFSLVRKVLGEAAQYATLAAGPSNSKRATRLVPFRQYYYRAKKLPNSPTPYQYTNASCGPSTPASAPCITLDAGFMRPGEKIRRLDTGEEITHPLRHFGNQPWQGLPSLGEGWPALLQQKPMVVRLEAVIDPVTPFLPPLHAIATQYSYRFSGVFAAAPPGENSAPGCPVDCTNQWICIENKAACEACGRKCPECVRADGGGLRCNELFFCKDHAEACLRECGTNCTGDCVARCEGNFGCNGADEKYCQDTCKINCMGPCRDSNKCRNRLFCLQNQDECKSLCNIDCSNICEQDCSDVESCFEKSWCSNRDLCNRDCHPLCTDEIRESCQDRTYCLAHTEVCQGCANITCVQSN